MSAKFSGFWTPPCPHFVMNYSTISAQPPLLCLLLGYPPPPSRCGRPLCMAPNGLNDKNILAHDEKAHPHLYTSEVDEGKSKAAILPLSLPPIRKPLCVKFRCSSGVILLLISCRKLKLLQSVLANHASLCIRLLGSLLVMI